MQLTDKKRGLVLNEVKEFFQGFRLYNLVMTVEMVMVLTTEIKCQKV